MAASAEISVVIPVYNDPGGIRATLESLTTQRDAPAYEVLIVDNNSTDTTGEVINEFETQYPKVVTGLSETDIQSSYAARNTGIKHASGEIIAFIDADITVEETWAANIYEVFHESDIDYLGYDVEMYIPEDKNTFWARYDVVMGLPIEHYLKTKQFAPTCALAVRREVLDEVGLFNEELISGGDKEFGIRVHEAGFRMDYYGGISIRHPARTTFREQLKKAKRIGRGQTQLWKNHDLAAHPLSPVRVLPPDPSRIKQRSKPYTSKKKMYVASYILKLYQTMSSIRYLAENYRG